MNEITVGIECTCSFRVKELRYFFGEGIKEFVACGASYKNDGSKFSFIKCNPETCTLWMLYEKVHIGNQR